MNRSNYSESKREFVRRCAALSAGMVCMPVSGLTGKEKDVKRKLAMFQEETVRGVMCRICPNECVLKEGELSKCNNRRVYGSKLYTLAFGNPCSVAVDPVEKKPLYHFLPGTRAFSIATAGCNLACLNCQNWAISQTSPDKTRNYDMMPDKVVSDCISNNCASIAYTYSEPITFYEYVYETASLAKKSGIKNILKSNGYIYPEPLKKLCSVIDGANIDFKSFNESTYLKLTGAKLEPILTSLKVLRDMGIWLEITNLIVPTWTDNLVEIRNMCRWLSKNGFSNVPLHFSRFHPTYKLEQLPPTPVNLLNRAAEIAKEEGLLYIYTGNAPGNELSDTKCPNCNNTLIIRQGYRISANYMKNGRCEKCGKTIDGIWK